MLGLEWKDIDFENNIIHVRRTSQYTAEKDIYTDTTKTRKSKRVSKMPVSIMNLIRQFKAEQEAYSLFVCKVHYLFALFLSILYRAVCSTAFMLYTAYLTA
ncbi:MAG: hypothetical protein BWZ04_01597 [Firmicutes bacterium ADurb.BinA205]|nr:MAG: hypothetical protein BWZ04_01597 [Firmicutes bacterium ADurb.BinA205]